ncbi:MAG: rhodanese-like domain-containing protein [Solirubrobacteraceae bacterium]
MASDYSPREVSDLLQGGDVQLIDVRQTYEHEAGRIAGGRLIELGALPEQAGSIDPSRPVILYCRSGARSGMAAQALTEAGFDAHNMTGGLLAWEAAGLPLEPEDGAVAEP